MLISYGKQHKQQVISILMPSFAVVVSLFLFLNGGLQLYPSRYTLEANWHITYSDINGWDWFFSNKDSQKNITTLSDAPGRFAHLLLTTEERVGRPDLKNLDNLHVPEALKLPYHFGYDKYATLGHNYSEELYLILNEKDKLLYQEVFPEIAYMRYLPEDFVFLEQDTKIAKLYTNGGFNSYQIFGTNEN
jgi:hypothetical protein